MIELTANELSKFIEKIELGSWNECWNWKGSTWSSGYGQFCFSRKGKSYSVSAHRTSFRFFNGKIPDNLQVNHRCDNKICVNPEHLYAGTQTDNMNDMIRRGRHVSNASKMCGEDNPKSKLAQSDVVEIRALFAKGIAQIELSKRFNISPFNVHCIVHRRTWKHV